MASLSANLIRQFGEQATFYHTVNGEYDPSLGETDGQITNSYISNVVPESYTNREIDGTLIKTDDIKLLAPEIPGYVPKPNDSVKFSQGRYRIISVDKTILNAHSVLFTLQVRK